MTTVAIFDINDAELRIIEGDKIVARDSGYALLQKSKVIYGMQAKYEGLFNPSNFFDRYWEHINQQSLPKINNAIRSNADLVYSQLVKLYQSCIKYDEIIVVVPGSYVADDLSVLLGIFQAGPIKVKAIIDSGVLAVKDVVDNRNVVSEHGDFAYVDIQIHKAVVTHVIANESIEKIKAETLGSVGVSELESELVKTVNHIFIDQLRFDPQHSAQGESELYKKIHELLRQDDYDNDIRVVLNNNGTDREVRFSAKKIKECAHNLVQKIVEIVPSDHVVVLSPRAAKYPGLRDKLGSVELLNDFSLSDMAQEINKNIDNQDEGIPYIASIQNLKYTQAEILNNETDLLFQQTNNDIPPTHMMVGKALFRLDLNKREAYLILDDMTVCKIHLDNNDTKLVAKLNWVGDKLYISSMNSSSILVNEVPVNADSNNVINSGDEFRLEGNSEMVYFLSERTP